MLPPPPLASAAAQAATQGGSEVGGGEVDGSSSEEEDESLGENEVVTGRVAGERGERVADDDEELEELDGGDEGNAKQGRNGRAPETTLRSLEINETAKAGGATARLNRYVIGLLAAGGVPESFFLDLVKQQLDVSAMVVSNVGHAIELLRSVQEGRRRVAVDAEDMSLALRMLLSGVTLNDPFLRRIMRKLLDMQLRDLGAGRVVLENSYNLMGVADPSGSLKPNQVAVITPNGAVSGPCLVYRPPSLLVSNIRRFDAVWPEELRAYFPDCAVSNCVVFPTCGERSATDCMAGGDLDGDIYLTIFRPEVVEAFQERPAPPRGEHAAQSELQPLPKSHTRLERSLVEHWITSETFQRKKIGTVGNYHLAHMDRDGPDCRACHELARLYEVVLDAAKTGQDIGDLRPLRPKQYPHYMHKPRSYHSTSLLGRIYDMVEEAKRRSTVDLTTAMDVDGETEHDDPFPCDPELLITGRKAMKLGVAAGDARQAEAERAVWVRRVEEFCVQLSSIQSLRDSMPSAARRAAVDRLYDRYRKMLYGGWVFSVSQPKEPRSVVARSLCLYEAAYGWARARATQELQGRSQLSGMSVPDAGVKGRSVGGGPTMGGENAWEVRANRDGGGEADADDDDDDEDEDALDCDGGDLSQAAVRFVWRVAGAVLCKFRPNKEHGMPRAVHFQSLSEMMGIPAVTPRTSVA